MGGDIVENNGNVFKVNYNIFDGNYDDEHADGEIKLESNSLVWSFAKSGRIDKQTISFPLLQ